MNSNRLLCKPSKVLIYYIHVCKVSGCTQLSDDKSSPNICKRKSKTVVSLGHTIFCLYLKHFVMVSQLVKVTVLNSRTVAQLQFCTVIVLCSRSAVPS